MGLFAVAAAITSLAVSGATAPPSHDDEINTYAAAMAVAQVASDKCPDIFVFVDGLTSLPRILHITPSDDMSVQLEIRGYTKTFTDQVEKAPKAWCDDVLAHFGPGGSLMPGLIQ